MIISLLLNVINQMWPQISSVHLVIIQLFTPTFFGKGKTVQRQDNEFSHDYQQDIRIIKEYLIQ